MIEEETVISIEVSDFAHVGVAEFEIKYVEVLLHAFDMCRFTVNYNTALDEPA